VIFVEAGIVDLGHLALSHGQARRLDLDVDFQPIALGGQTYAIEGGLARARVDVSRTSTGHALRLRLAPELCGPCVRCLEDARLPLEIDVREVDQPSAGDEELRSPYVDEGELDLERWANDAVVLALPAQPLCRADCAGLCPVCGESLNDTDPETHQHEKGGDPRMAKLRELRLDE
jgi:DUF177 domain-containing protein